MECKPQAYPTAISTWRKSNELLQSNERWEYYFFLFPYSLVGLFFFSYFLLCIVILSTLSQQHSLHHICSERCSSSLLSLSLRSLALSHCCLVLGARCILTAIKMWQRRRNCGGRLTTILINYTRVHQLCLVNNKVCVCILGGRYVHIWSQMCLAFFS